MTRNPLRLAAFALLLIVALWALADILTAPTAEPTPRPPCTCTGR